MTKRDADIVRAGNIPSTAPERVLADRLHTQMCDREHDNHCDYFLSDWDDPNYIRCFYLLKARALLDLTSGDVNLARVILEAIFETP